MLVATARRFGRWPGWMVLAIALLVSSSAHAEGQGRSIGFSNLIVRLEQDAEIAVAGDDYRVSILENLRAAGLNAVGAEDIVFGRDNGKRAELLLGGTVRELQCQHWYSVHSCRIGIEWRVLDVQRDAVVYTVLTRSVVYRIPTKGLRAVGKQLVMGAVGSLARRQALRNVLASS